MTGRNLGYKYSTSEGRVLETCLVRGEDPSIKRVEVDQL